MERQHCRAARIIFGFPLDMPTVDVLATAKWNTLVHQYKLSIIKLFYKGFYGMLPHALPEQSITHSYKSVSRMKNGLIAPRFGQRTVKTTLPIEGLSYGTP